MTKKEIQQELSRRGLRPLKQFGQNFLHDQNLCRWLVMEATKDLKPQESILEIGPGLGALTTFLLEKNLNVTAIEKDRGLVQFLRDHFSKAPHFQLIEGDALEELPKLTQSFSCVLGNLPYNISSQLLITLLDLPAPPKEMIFTLQLELAQRLASKPGVKNYGALSVILQIEYEIEMLRTFPPTVFLPEPEVDSAVIRLMKRNQSLISAENRLKFRELVKQGFSQRRKKLSNLLPINDSRRAEELSIEEWVRLFQKL